MSENLSRCNGRHGCPKISVVEMGDRDVRISQSLRWHRKGENLRRCQHVGYGVQAAKCLRFAHRILCASTSFVVELLRNNTSEGDAKAYAPAPTVCERLHTASCGLHTVPALPFELLLKRRRCEGLRTSSNGCYNEFTLASNAQQRRTSNARLIYIKCPITSNAR